MDLKDRNSWSNKDIVLKPNMKKIFHITII